MRVRVAISLFVVLLAVVPLRARAVTPGAQAESTAAKPAQAKPATEKPRPAAAKPRRTSVAPRGFISINGGYQASTNTFSSTWTFDYYADLATMTAQYPVRGGFLFDAGGGVRLWRDMLVGASFSFFSRTDNVAMTGSLPYPFTYTFREAEGSDSGLGHDETAVHLQATWMLRPHGRVQVGLSAGPTVFLVKQALVATPNFNEAYPYDTVTVTGATTKQQSATTVGFNVGGDIWYALSRKAAVGMLLRFARATANFEAPDKSAIEVHAGGAQVAAGVRLRFLDRKPGVATGKPAVKGKK
ncbi:MAG: hypothetical protein ACM3NQ_07565 [Bacteroidales bacterium]